MNFNIGDTVKHIKEDKTGTVKIVDVKHHQSYVLFDDGSSKYVHHRNLKYERVEQIQRILDNFKDK